ncbi:hypothetical protein OG393_14990 [Streptomyces sp. NBC_01216]|uniref:hypothetical protein n=1 Tax=Streptomyces sp. NBC_01216 TaxID=2903778 RepID=UPI002E0D8A1D|nr:hypothetical protein OG393_14990 [Streptomyces sp. NBC_01216]
MTEPTVIREHRMRRRTRTLVVGTMGTALLALGGTGCGPGSPPRGSAPVSSTPAPSASSAENAPTTSPPPFTTAPEDSTATPTGDADTRPASPTPTPSAAPTTRRPPAPTHLSAHVAVAGGRLTLSPDGPAREFTVTLRNGNSHAYRHLLVAFQMETVPGAPEHPGYTLERWDPAAGIWRAAALRFANDAYPYALYQGGAPLARNAVLTHRYRVRALAGAPAGPNPLLVSLVDTDADARLYYGSVPQTTLG